jgi:hypothetical protein
MNEAERYQAIVIGSGQGPPLWTIGNIEETLGRLVVGTTID